jgi:hypothetical protein
MRKLFLLALLAIVATLGVAAAPASAGGCASSQDYPVFWDGQFAYQALLTGCSGVNGVQISGNNSAGWDTTGIYWSLHGWHLTNTPSQYGLYTASQYGWWTLHVPFFGVGCNGTVMNVQTSYWYRVRQSFGNTWGPWHQHLSGNQQIC